MPASQASAVPRVIDVRLRPPAPWFVDMSLYRFPSLRPQAASAAEAVPVGDEESHGPRRRQVGEVPYD